MDQIFPAKLYPGVYRNKNQKQKIKKVLWSRAWQMREADNRTNIYEPIL
jgi:hypothetical protein